MSGEVAVGERATVPPVDDPFGPQYSADDSLTARMRFHQSWWRYERLGLLYGVNALKIPYGKYLTASDTGHGRNFLTDAIHWCAQERIAPGGGVEKFRCTRNLLSSQPMAFNMFAPLHVDPDLAALLLNPLLPGGVLKATVDIEWAPPRRPRLGDATSFDVAVHYTTRDGQPALAGIETKLTEPFSQRTYGHDDVHTDRYRAVAAGSNAWRNPADADLTNKQWNQIWRNHLLVESIRQREPDLLGCEIVVHHLRGTRCAKAIEGYTRFLTNPADTFGAFTLDRIVETWKPLLTSSSQTKWINDFEDRYLNPGVSEDAFTSTMVLPGNRQ